MLTKIYHQENDIDRLITPSWLSGLLVVIVSLVIVLGSLGMLYYRSSDLKTIMPARHPEARQVNDYESIQRGVEGNQFMSNIPLFLFWGVTGLVAYSFTMSIGRSLRGAVELTEEMNYVHADRRSLVRTAVGRVLLRVAALAGWFLLLQTTIHTLIPYALALVYAGSAMGALMTAAYSIGAAVVLIVCVHAHVILLRLIALRPRLLQG